MHCQITQTCYLKARAFLRIQRFLYSRVDLKLHNIENFRHRASFQIPFFLSFFRKTCFSVAPMSHSCDIVHLILDRFTLASTLTAVWQWRWHSASCLSVPHCHGRGHMQTRGTRDLNWNRTNNTARARDLASRPRICICRYLPLSRLISRVTPRSPRISPPWQISHSHTATLNLASLGRTNVSKMRQPFQKEGSSVFRHKTVSNN